MEDVTFVDTPPDATTAPTCVTALLRRDIKTADEEQLTKKYGGDVRVVRRVRDVNPRDMMALRDQRFVFIHTYDNFVYVVSLRDPTSEAGPVPTERAAMLFAPAVDDTAVLVHEDGTVETATRSNVVTVGEAPDLGPAAAAAAPNEDPSVYYDMAGSGTYDMAGPGGGAGEMEEA